MYSLATYQTYDDYFTAISRRPGNGVLFCRFIGYNQRALLFFKQLQVAAAKGGAYVAKPMENPTGAVVNRVAQATALHQFAVDPAYLAKAVDGWLGEAPAQGRKLLADSLLELLAILSKSGVQDNMLKNMFVKWMHWCRTVVLSALLKLGEDEPPKVLYEGDISKHEVYMLRILSRAGCDIAYVNFVSDQSYLAVDPKSVWSMLVEGPQKTTPAVHFSKIDLGFFASLAQIQAGAAELEKRLETNTWLHQDFMEMVKEANGGRGGIGNKIHNLYVRYLGVDEEDAYLARVYKLKAELEQSRKALVMVENTIGNPTLQEVKAAPKVQYSTKEELAARLAGGFALPGNKELEAMVRGALFTFIQGQERSLEKLYTLGMKLLCWLVRYREPLFVNWTAENLPVFLYYGLCNESEAWFMELLAHMPVDVLYLCPDKTAKATLALLDGQTRAREEELPQTAAVYPFPKKEPKLRAATAAYHAAREMDTALYSDTGLFRNRQFTQCNPVTLTTTYEEISILWREEARYRPNFEASAGRVAVPNLFARVCGVKNRYVSGYFTSISDLLGDDTLYIPRFPYLTNDRTIKMSGNQHIFWQGGKILPEAIKKHPGYPYDYLNGDTQDYMLDKIQQVIDLDWVKDAANVRAEILTTLLNLDQKLLHTIQKFDFTKQIPKVVAVHADQSMPTLADGILFAFLNLAGFDIAVFTPTGYRDVDKFVNDDAYQEHQIGEFLFDLPVPNLAEYNKGLLGRLFGRK